MFIGSPLRKIQSKCCQIRTFNFRRREFGQLPLFRAGPIFETCACRQTPRAAHALCCLGLGRFGGDQARHPRPRIIKCAACQSTIDNGRDPLNRKGCFRNRRCQDHLAPLCWWGNSQLLFFEIEGPE